MAPLTGKVEGSKSGMPETFQLPDGLYPFIDQHFPLSELAMIKAPTELETLFREQSARQGIELVRDVPVELRCRTDAFGDAVFLIWWPYGEDHIHMLAPARFRQGSA